MKPSTGGFKKEKRWVKYTDGKWWVLIATIAHTGIGFEKKLIDGPHKPYDKPNPTPV